MMSEVIMASPDQDSATSGIQEAIDALGERSGSVRIPAGKWRLRQSIVLRIGIAVHHCEKRNIKLNDERNLDRPRWGDSYLVP